MSCAGLRWGQFRGSRFRRFVRVRDIGCCEQLSVRPVRNIYFFKMSESEVETTSEASNIATKLDRLSLREQAVMYDLGSGIENIMAIYSKSCETSQVL